MFNAYLHGAKIASGETELEALKAAISPTSFVLSHQRKKYGPLEWAEGN